ncbi:MAG TPA: DNA polymerase IV [Kineosporiaceae bacterium]
MSPGPWILHADLDAFYASVEQLLDPTLRRRPIAVGGSAQGGVVLAASYEAKVRGVQGGMPGWRARQLCPDIRFVRGHFSEYQRLADQVMDFCADLTPAVERISIDEAFLDVSGAIHLFGPPAAIGAALRGRVRAEVGLPISVGAARTKHLAKVASQVAKPDGLVVVEPGDERAFLDPLPVRLIWGVGPVAEQRPAERGITTIGQLARAASADLERLLGPAVGARLGALARNEDPRRVVTSGRARSVGAQSALGRTLRIALRAHQTRWSHSSRLATRRSRFRAPVRAGGSRPGGVAAYDVSAAPSDRVREQDRDSVTESRALVGPGTRALGRVRMLAGQRHVAAHLGHLTHHLASALTDTPRVGSALGRHREPPLFPDALCDAPE